MFKEQGYILSDNDIIQELESYPDESEKQFNQWITHQFYEEYNKHITVGNASKLAGGNGVPDLLILTQDKTYLIESKFETTRLRPEQQAWQIKANSIPTDAVVVTLCAYPKTKRLVVQQYNDISITNDGIHPVVDTEFTLDNEGFKEFINYFNASKLV